MTRRGRRNPFKRTRPAEWATMSRAKRSQWNRDNWVPEQYVADASLKREANRFAKRREKAEAAHRRGGGIFGLAQALASRDNPRRRRGRRSTRRYRR